MSAAKSIQAVQPAFSNRFSLLSLFLGVLLASATAAAQVSFTGTAASEDFGDQNILATRVARSFGFSVSAGTKIGSIAVLTTGLASLDFANAAGTTCTATTYSSTSTCSVSVTFTPQYAGPRIGAVVFFSKAGNTGTVLGSVPVYGMGIGPQVAYGPGTVSSVDRTMHGVIGLGNPGAMTTDAAGNLYVLDSAGTRPGYSLVKVPANGSAITTTQPAVNGLSLYLPSSVAVDGAGNIFIGDFGRRVIEVPVGTGAATAIAPIVNNIPLNYPSGLAVDGAGDLFIADYINNRVLEVPGGGGAAIAINPTVNGIGLNDPHGLTLDGNGNLFIADLGNNRIVKFPLGGGAATAIAATANGEGLRNPMGVALDGAADLFIADDVNHRVVEVPASGNAATAIDPTMYYSGLGEVYSVAVDGAGDLFFTQGGLAAGNNIVEEEQYGHNPTFSFVVPTEVGSTDTSDGVQTVQIVNIGNRAMTMTGLSFPLDFSNAEMVSDSCTSTTVLNPGQMCELSVEFTPQNTGALTESITLTDNAQNTPGSQQQIKLTGTAERLAAITSPAPGGTLLGATATFTWSAGTGATAYYLSIGSTGVGSSNVFQSGKRTVTSWTATGLPTNGETLYVRLTTYFGSIQMQTDYTYSAASAAALTSPAPGTVLSGSSVTFSWKASAQATSYILWLGNTGVGSYNLYSSPSLTGTSIAVTKLPTAGGTIYARLYTRFSGGQLYTDYVYTAK